MAGMDFANIDWGTVAAQACGPDSTWNGTRCVPNPKPAATEQSVIDWGAVDWAALASQTPSPYNENSGLQGQYSKGFNAADATSGLTAPAADATTVTDPFVMPDLRGDLAGDYTMNESGYVIDPATGKVVGPTGESSGWTPYQLENQDPVDPRFRDERLGMREDAYSQALADGFTAEQIDEFLGVVGTEDWFQMLADDPAIMDPTLEGHDPALAQAVLDAQGRLDETGTATVPWIDSPEFAAKYSGPAGEVPAGEGPAGEVPAGEGPAGEVPAGEVPAGEVPAAFDSTPDGVPTFVATQVDELNIINQRLKSITDAHNKLLASGIEEIDGIEEALTEAESKIYESQYGAVDPLTGEVLTPGEMDRLLSTFDTRRTTSKKNRATDRAEILAIMTDEGVPEGLAQTSLDMIQAIHGDSIDTQFDYIESMWRIGKLSHDERTSMIGNMVASYKLQLRDTVVEMLMAEEVNTADAVAAAQQDALRADTIASLFPDMSEDQVYGLMRGGMADLLQLPADKEIGMIEAGEWAGYTQGEKSNVLLNAGYVRNGDGTFTAPAADAADDDKVLSKLMPDGTTWSGTADEYYDEHGEYIFAAGDEEITQDLPDGTSFTGTVADYVARSGVYPFAAAAEQDDPNTFTVSVDRINELDPTGAWLRGSGLQVVGARPDSPQRAGASGFVTMNWDDWIFTEDPYEAVKDPEEEDRKYQTTVNGESWYGTPQEYTAVTGKYMFAPDDPAPVPVPSSIMQKDFPGLKVARPTLKVVDGEYWLTPEDINVYGQIAELREGPEMDFGEMLRNGAYPGYPAPINMREQVQAMAVQLKEKEGFELVALDQLYITAVLMEAPVNEDYARLAAKYLGVNVDVNGPNGAKTGHIDHTTGEFVRIGDLRTYR